MNLVVKEERSVNQIPSQKAGKGCGGLASGYYCSRFALFKLDGTAVFCIRWSKCIDCMKLQKNMHVIRVFSAGIFARSPSACPHKWK